VARRRRDDEELPGVLDVVPLSGQANVLLRQLPQERLPAPSPAVCESRYLGEQRCDDCGVFCRRIGFGGTCPHCDEAVAVEDLMGAEAPGA
jgi:hypothetical protein